MYGYLFYQALQLSNFSHLKILRPANIETTSFGAALACALGQGLIGFEHIDALWKIQTEFDQQNVPYYNAKSHLWKSWLQKIYLA